MNFTPFNLQIQDKLVCIGCLIYEGAVFQKASECAIEVWNKNLFDYGGFWGMTEVVHQNPMSSGLSTFTSTFIDLNTTINTIADYLSVIKTGFFKPYFVNLSPKLNIVEVDRF